MDFFRNLELCCCPTAKNHIAFVDTLEEDHLKIDLEDRPVCQCPCLNFVRLQWMCLHVIGKKKNNIEECGDKKREHVRKGAGEGKGEGKGKGKGKGEEKRLTMLWK